MTKTGLIVMRPEEAGVTHIPIKPSMYYDTLLASFDSKEFICGCGAAFINISITYPIYKMGFRQMLHGIHISSAFKQLRHEGIAFLYRGIFPPMAQKTISLALMFGVYDGTRRYYVENFQMNAYTSKMLAAVSAGNMEATLMPFERVQTLLADAKFHDRFANTALAFRYILVNHGFLELYRGLWPVLLRNGPSNACFFTLREEANKILPIRESISAHSIQGFLSGACIGATTSTIFYPINVIKTAMQSDMGHPSESIWATSKRIYIERDCRISQFYRGCAINSARSFFSWGIINLSFENLKKLIT